jgi:N6-L-threonylcarbamoyladenine synthase
MRTILGIESSCDETAAALVGSDRRILAQRIASQDEAHRPYGGVVPEIAARAHAEKLAPLIEATLADAGMSLRDVDAVAATAGPGLIGGVMVGLVTAKALAMAADKPLIAINHLEAHALSPRLADPALEFPYGLLLVSGGHCQILRVDGVGKYRRLATTIDDALGEAFDKTAKILGLPYPGGPSVERLAKDGNPKAVPLPRPLVGSGEPHFSFAGLKSAVLRAKQAQLSSVRPELVEGPSSSSEEKSGASTSSARTGGYSDADIAASFQQAAVDCVTDRLRIALDKMDGITALVAAGGVAANQEIRAALDSTAGDYGLRFTAPPLALCTDNAAMVAWAGIELFAEERSDPLDYAARPRWPLDPEAEPVRGAGVKA